MCEAKFKNDYSSDGRIIIIIVYKCRTAGIVRFEELRYTRYYYYIISTHLRLYHNII